MCSQAPGFCASSSACSAGPCLAFWRFFRRFCRPATACGVFSVFRFGLRRLCRFGLPGLMPRRLFRFGLRRLFAPALLPAPPVQAGLIRRGFACPGLLQPGAGCGQLFLQLRRAGRLACGPAHGTGHRPVLALFHGRIRHHQRHARIFFAQHQPQRQRRQRAGRGHHLADAEGAHHQAVGAQALDEKPPQAVPHHIHQHHFAMEAAVLFIGGQQQKAHQAPKRFVQKTWGARAGWGLP